MGKTSSEVKRRYNNKTYKQFNAQIRNEEFDKIEAERASLGMSRAEFIRFLLDEYHKNKT